MSTDTYDSAMKLAEEYRRERDELRAAVKANWDRETRRLSNMARKIIDAEADRDRLAARVAELESQSQVRVAVARIATLEGLLVEAREHLAGLSLADRIDDALSPAPAQPEAGSGGPWVCAAGTKHPTGKLPGREPQCLCEGATPAPAQPEAPCADCGKADGTQRPCPLCGKVTCDACAEDEDKSCCPPTPAPASRPPGWGGTVGGVHTDLDGKRAPAAREAQGRPVRDMPPCLADACRVLKDLNCFEAASYVQAAIDEFWPIKTSTSNSAQSVSDVVAFPSVPAEAQGRERPEGYEGYDVYATLKRDKYGEATITSAASSVPAPQPAASGDRVAWLNECTERPGLYQRGESVTFAHDDADQYVTREEALTRARNGFTPVEHGWMAPATPQPASAEQPAKRRPVGTPVYPVGGKCCDKQVVVNEGAGPETQGFTCREHGWRDVAKSAAPSPDRRAPGSQGRPAHGPHSSGNCEPRLRSGSEVNDDVARALDDRGGGR